MTDPNEHEKVALQAAADRGGEFIESIKKTDMARWSVEQWQQFIETVCGGYVDSLCQQQAMIAESVGRVTPPMPAV